MNKRIALVFVVLLGCSALALARAPREQQRIDFLIESLSSLKGAVFIRNGSEYGAAEARSHLEKKLAYGGERLKTAEDFIKYCASQSSLSHKPYQIRFSDGKVTDTSAFFTEKLKEFDAKQR